MPQSDNPKEKLMRKVPDLLTVIWIRGTAQ